MIFDKTPKKTGGFVVSEMSTFKAADKALKQRQNRQYSRSSQEIDGTADYYSINRIFS